MMEATGKPPERQSRTRLTFEQKVQALQRLENGEKQIALAKELGCSRRALSRLKQNKAFFQRLQLKPSDSQRKSRHSIRNLALESGLTSFLSVAKRNGFPVTGSVVRHAALKIRDELLAEPEQPAAERASLQGFQASINWSKAFVKRHGLRNAQVTQEGAVAEIDDGSCREMKNLLLEYELDCIVSVEKVNLFYKLLPTDLSCSAQSSIDATETSRKNSLDERVVVLAAANTTGSLKMPPTIVWKEQVPGCFDGRPCAVPHLFHPQAWVDDDVFKTWFCCVLLPAVRRYTSKKVALVVSEDWLQSEVCDSQGQVQVIRLPRSELGDQGPLNMGVISVLRRKYRYSMLDMVIRMISCGNNGLKSGFGQISVSPGLTDGHSANLLDLGDLLEGAWGSITESFIGKCWVKAGILPEEHSRALLEAYGRDVATTAEEVYASCCTGSQLENARALEKVLMECRLVVPIGGEASKRTVGLVKKLNGVGRRELDGWFEVEETGRGMRALGSELDEMVCGLGSELIVKKGVKRTAEEMMVGTWSEVGNVSGRRKEEGLRNGLPSVGYLMDLIAPIEGVLDEREGGKAGQLVRSLKMELVRLKCDEERRKGEEDCVNVDVAKRKAEGYKCQAKNV